MLCPFKSNRRGRLSGNHKHAQRRLRFENLETRTLMSVSAAITIPSAEFNGLRSQETAQLNNLAAKGSAAAAAGMNPPQAYVDSNHVLIIHGCKGDDTVTLAGNRGAQIALTHRVNNEPNPRVFEQKFNGVKQVIFFAYDGHNTFINETNVPSKALGGAGVDEFKGGGKKDVFYGLGGEDVLDGRGGSDRLYGGTGRDKLTAGNAAASEKDTVNILKGGNGDDVLLGGGGLDKMYGNKGNDTLIDDNGNGYLNGGPDNDVLKGTDTIYLEMHGGGGNDKLWRRSSISDYQRIKQDDYCFRDKNANNALLTAMLDMALADLMLD